MYLFFEKLAFIFNPHPGDIQYFIYSIILWLALVIGSAFLLLQSDWFPYFIH